MKEEKEKEGKGREQEKEGKKKIGSHKIATMLNMPTQGIQHHCSSGFS